jgi:hypothetical protein
VESRRWAPTLGMGRTADVANAHVMGEFWAWGEVDESMESLTVKKDEFPVESCME